VKQTERRRSLSGFTVSGQNHLHTKMADEDEVLYEAALVAAAVTTIASVVIRKRRRHRRTIWVRPLFQMRSQYGAYHLLMAELRESDTDRYKGFTRLNVEQFDELVSLVKSDISGSCRNRLPIPADMRLAVTLRYLATGESNPTYTGDQFCNRC
jgi:hypothetical protein